jgi:hypothetical protein
MISDASYNRLNANSVRITDLTVEDLTITNITRTNENTGITSNAPFKPNDVLINNNREVITIVNPKSELGIVKKDEITHEKMSVITFISILHDDNVHTVYRCKFHSTKGIYFENLMYVYNKLHKTLYCNHSSPYKNQKTMYSIYWDLENNEGKMMRIKNNQVINYNWELQS